MYSAWVTGHDVTAFISIFWRSDIYFWLFTCKSKSCKNKKGTQTFSRIVKVRRKVTDLVTHELVIY